MLLVSVSFLVFALCVFMLRKLCEKKNKSVYVVIVVRWMKCVGNPIIHMWIHIEHKNAFYPKKKDGKKQNEMRSFRFGVYFSVPFKNIMTSKCRSNLKCVFSFILLQLTQNSKRWSTASERLRTHFHWKLPVWHRQAFNLFQPSDIRAHRLAPATIFACI